MDNQEIEIELQNDPIEIEIENSNTVIIREENTIKSISVNGVEQTVDENKNVDITVPTKISDLNNDNNTVQDANYVHTDNNFTTAEKEKLANLENYDDTEIKQDITDLQTNKANKSETYTKTETDTLLQGKADVSDIPDVSGFITKDVNNLTNYTLKTNTGSLIDLEINSTTYVVTLRLKDVDGNVISTDTIDLPLESVVVSGRYDNTTKKVILTLENGSEADFSVADLVAGLQTEITSTNKLNADYVDDSNSGNKFTNTTEKQTWNNKYEKPSGGIPKTDLASAVQNSLNKADSALQEHQDVSGKEDKSNKVTEIDENSTDTQYPSAKAVQNSQAEQDENIEANTEEIQNILNMLPKGTATGEEITINDSADYKFKKFGIKGNTEQDSYTGKNFLNALAITRDGIIVENEGATIKMPILDSGNGYYGVNKKLGQLCPQLEIGQTYKLIANSTGMKKLVYIGEVWNFGTTKTITQNMLDKDFVLYANSTVDGETNQVIITNLMIIKSTETDENFEPYVRTEFQVQIQNIHKK